MDKFPIDVLQHCIFDKLNFLMQIRFRQVCQWFHRLEIHDFRYMDDKHFRKLSDAILINYPFIRFLNANHNPAIKNVNHMTNLQELSAGGCDCGIDDNGISDLNLIELNAYSNSTITNVNHMFSLKKLIASYSYGIGDDGIKHINLDTLVANSNPKITNVNHMSNLKHLYATCGSGIDDEGIKDLKLVVLISYGNEKITRKV